MIYGAKNKEYWFSGLVGSGEERLDGIIIEAGFYIL